MEIKAHNVTVGAFILAGIVALLVAVIFIGGGQFGNQYAYYQTSFTGSVTGVAKGTLVRYNGIDVGHVNKLEFDRDDPKRVIVILEVDSEVAIHTDSAAIVESEGLTGITYVEIEGGSATTPIIMPARFGEPYPVIASKPSSFQQVKDVAPKLLNRLDTVADRTSDLLNAENREAIAQTLKNLTVATERLNQTLASTNDTAKRIGRLSTNVDGVVANVDGVVTNVDGFVTNIDGVATNVDSVVINFDSFVTAAKTQIAESTAQLNQLLGQSRALVESLTRLSNDIERQPTELLFGDRREGYRPK